MKCDFFLCPAHNEDSDDGGDCRVNSPAQVEECNVYKNVKHPFDEDGTKRKAHDAEAMKRMGL